jgi:hypothetical protein
VSDLAEVGLQSLIEDVRVLGKGLNDDEWNAPSAGHGWSVRNVVASMARGFHALSDPHTEPMPPFADPEAGDVGQDFGTLGVIRASRWPRSSRS